MCAARDCAGGLDYCCAEDCTPYGGLRPCPSEMAELPSGYCTPSPPAPPRQPPLPPALPHPPSAPYVIEWNAYFHLLLPPGLACYESPFYQLGVDYQFVNVHSVFGRAHGGGSYVRDCANICLLSARLARIENTRRTRKAPFSICIWC